MGVKFCEKTGAWVDGYLKEWLEHAQEAVKKNWDFVCLVDGVEGSGKSGLAITAAYYLDRTLTHDRIVFTPEQFIKAVDNGKKGQAIVWDEFVLGGLSSEVMGTIQRTITKKLVTIRKKGLYIFLVIPYIFMLGIYFVPRTRLLIHTYSPDGIKRGHFKLYNYTRKLELFLKGKKFYEYKVPPNRRGEFGNAQKWAMIDWKEYEHKKDVATDMINVDGKKENRYRSALGRAMLNYDLISDNMQATAKVVGIPARTLQKIRQDAADAAAEETLNNTESTGGNSEAGAA